MKVLCLFGLLVSNSCPVHQALRLFRSLSFYTLMLYDPSIFSSSFSTFFFSSSSFSLQLFYRSGPVSRVLYPSKRAVIIYLGPALPPASSDLPEDLETGRLVDHERPVLLLGLAPGGVYPVVRSPGHRVRSYRTISPLPRRSRGGMFLWHFP